MPTYSDDEIVMVSAIEHFSYCPRQCALIHVEHVYDENVFTLRGSMAHVRADEPTERTEAGVTVERALPIWSEEHGLYGRADVVEFNPDGTVCPVEYKIAPKRAAEHAELQLCAQAICLEEMFGKPITHGALYSSSSHQRRPIEFTPELRAKTLALIDSVRAMQNVRLLPEPVNDARCPNCSLVHVCMPSGVGGTSSLKCEDFLFKPCSEEVAE